MSPLPPGLAYYEPIHVSGSRLRQVEVRPRRGRVHIGPADSDGGGFLLALCHRVLEEPDDSGFAGELAALSVQPDAMPHRRRYAGEAIGRDMYRQVIGPTDPAQVCRHCSRAAERMAP